MLDPVTLSTALGVLGIGGLSLGGSAFAAKQSYKYSMRLLNTQLAWQERMANTAHQREVKDLRAAGLNPILSANGGQGAATPTASASQFQVANPADTAISTISALSNLQNSAAQTKLAAANAELASAKADAVKMENSIRGKGTKAGGNLLDALEDFGSRIGGMLSAPKGSKFAPNGQVLAVPTKKVLEKLPVSTAKEIKAYEKRIEEIRKDAIANGLTPQEIDENLGLNQSAKGGGDGTGYYSDTKSKERKKPKSGKRIIIKDAYYYKDGKKYRYNF